MIDALSEGYVGDGPCRYQVVLNGASDAAMTATKTETKGECWVIERRGQSSCWLESHSVAK